MITQTPIEIEQVNDIIEKVFDVVKDDDTTIVMASLLTMLIMATYPKLEGDQLIETVENASQMLLTLGPQDLGEAGKNLTLN